MIMKCDNNHSYDWICIVACRASVPSSTQGSWPVAVKNTDVQKDDGHTDAIMALRTTPIKSTTTRKKGLLIISGVIGHHCPLIRALINLISGGDSFDAGPRWEDHEATYLKRSSLGLYKKHMGFFTPKKKPFFDWFFLTKIWTSLGVPSAFFRQHLRFSCLWIGQRHGGGSREQDELCHVVTCVFGKKHLDT